MKLALAAVVIAALQSCISINPNGYEMLSAEQRAKVVRPNRPIEELTRCDTIYIVNDSIVRDFLRDKDLAIVCCYLTICTSEYCLRPDLIHRNLQDCGLPFVMIAGDYYCARDYNVNYPFITIDSDHYKTKRYNRSIKRLFLALGCGDNWWHDYTLFRHGEYLGSGRSLEEAMKLIEP